MDLSWPCRLGESLDEGPVWLLHGVEDVPRDVAERWTGVGARLLPVAVKGGQLDPVAMLTALGAEGVTRVFCEGGGALAASFLQAGLVDRLVVFSAGKVLGAEGTPGIGALGVDRLAAAPQFELVDVRKIGDDVMHQWEKAAGATAS